MKLRVRERLTLAKEAAKSLVRGNRAVRQGRETDDLSFCHGERSDPLEVRQRDPSHCYHGAGAIVQQQAQSNAIMCAVSLASIAGGAAILLWQPRTPMAILLALLLLVGGFVGVAYTCNRKARQ